MTMFKRLVALWKQVQEVQAEALENKPEPPAPEDVAAVAALKAQAQSCSRLGDWAGAEHCFREVVARAPQDADGHALLGHFLYTRAHAGRDAPAFRSQQAEALAYLHAAVRLDPDLYRAQYPRW
jgi:tetratricopeptide (TPR) repeat protein